MNTIKGKGQVLFYYSKTGNRLFKEVVLRFSSQADMWAAKKIVDPTNTFFSEEALGRTLECMIECGENIGYLVRYGAEIDQLSVTPDWKRGDSDLGYCLRGKEWDAVIPIPQALDAHT